MMDAKAASKCAWCDPDATWARFNVCFWLKQNIHKRKWMAVTQNFKGQVSYCPMCGRGLGKDINVPSKKGDCDD